MQPKLISVPSNPGHHHQRQRHRHGEPDRRCPGNRAAPGVIENDQQAVNGAPHHERVIRTVPKAS